VNFGAQEFGEEISRLKGISENANMLRHDMQPNALLIWQNFIIIKSECYKPTPLEGSRPQDSGSARE
jgi:hypothetical protein